MIFVFKTSVKNKTQLKILKPHIDNLLSIGRWNFDLEDCDKILRIDSEENVVYPIINLLKSYNFECEELEENTKMNENTNIQTNRLLITPLTERDSDFIFEILNTEGWIKYIGERNIKSIGDAALYIHKIISNPNYTYLVFKLKENKKSIGLVTLIKRPYLAYCDIGFAILPKYEKMGYAYEASLKYIDVLEQSKLYLKLVAITVPENSNSISLLTKLGFNYFENMVEENEILAVYQKQIS